MIAWLVSAGLTLQPASGGWGWTPAPRPEAGRVVVGPARFTMVTPQCIRLEYHPAGHFVEAPSLFAACRDRRDGGARVIREASRTVIETSAMTLTYTPDGRPFGPQNLQILVRKGDGPALWRPGQSDTNNLGGTVRTLDGWDGARKLPDGLLSRAGWHLLDDSQTPLLADGWVKARPPDAGTDWYFFGYGEDYKAALRSLTAIGGEIPLPRRYALGVWYSRYWPYSSAEYRQIVQEYAAHGFPLDVIVMDMDWHRDGWTGYSWNRKLLPDAEALLAWFHQQGLAVTLNDHPADGVQPHEDCYPDFMKALGRDPAARPGLPFDAGSETYLKAFYDHTHAPLNKAGVDFWWLDWQQYPDTRSIPSLSNLAWLNHYYYQRSGDQGRRGLSFSRWAGWGDHRHPIHFSGDASTTFRMLAFEVPFTATAGNAGCFFWSHDIGGHMGGRDEESYARWCQFGAFSAALRSHSTRSPALDRRPWTYAPWAGQSMRISFQLRARFFPYTYSAARQACAESVPLLRPMYLEWPAEEAAYHQPRQYFYGDHLLVAPVAEAGSGPRRLGRQAVWFPPGATWYNFFTGEAYTGGQEALVAATIDEFPLYIRGGVPIPMRAFTPRMATTPLTELVVRCYPGADGRSATNTLYEDDGLSLAYRKGASARTVLSYRRDGGQVTVRIAPAAGKYEGQPRERAYVLEFPNTDKAATVRVDGWPAMADYVEAEGLNRVIVPARSIRRGCEVVLAANPLSADTPRVRAFAARAGLDVPAAGVTLERLLQEALSRTTNALERRGILAAAGIGAFEMNETAYGYPEGGTVRHFVPDGDKAVSAAGNGLAVEVGNPGEPASLPAALAKAYSGGARKITIVPGTYVMPATGSAPILLDSWKDATLLATGVTIVAEDPARRPLQLRQCERVVVEGGVLRFARPSFTQGRITAIRRTGGETTVDWRIDAGYEIPPGDSSLDIVDKETRLLRVGTGDFHCAKRETIEPGLLRLHQVDAGFGTAQEGDWIVTRLSRGGLVDVRECTGCTFRKVTLQNSGFAAFFEGGGGGNRFLECRVMPGPRPAGATEDQLVGCGADGFHSVGTTVGPHLERCSWEGVLHDDCIAIHGSFQTVASSEGRKLVLEAGRRGGFAVGDPVRISGADGYHAEFTCVGLRDIRKKVEYVEYKLVPREETVPTILTVRKGNKPEFLDRDRVKFTVGRGVTAEFFCKGVKTVTREEEFLELTLDGESGAKTGMRASNPRRDGAGFKILNCTLGNCRSRGILVKGDNGLIEGNTISGCGMSAISIGPEFFWGEADYCRNVTVRGNTLRGNVANGGNSGVVLVHGDGARGNRGITIVDNVFDLNHGRSEIRLEWTEGASIAGNTFNPGPSQPQADALVVISESRGISLKNNQLTPAAAGWAPVKIGARVEAVEGNDATGFRGPPPGLQ